MKKIILIIATVSTFAACKDRTMTASSAETDSLGTTADPVGTAVPPKTIVKKEVHYVYTDQSASPAQQPARKKEWSKAAKGTAIGAGGGALVGALVSKKKGKGAIIGGVVGAGAGYILGRHKDKKDGRVH